MKNMKRIGSLVLILALCLTLGVSAFASTSTSDTTFTITVNNAAVGETYSAYKIFDVTYNVDDSGNGSYAYSIKADDPWYSIVSGEDSPFALTLAQDGSYIVTLKEGKDENDVASFFKGKTVPAGTDASGTAEATKAADADSASATITVTDGPGYYFVTTTAGATVMLDTTNPSVTIEEKNNKPAVTKLVKDTTQNESTGSTSDNAENGDSLEYTLTVTGIANGTGVVVHDYMDADLTLVAEAGATGITVTVYEPAAEPGSQDTVVTTTSNDYAVTVDPQSCTGTTDLSGCSFEVSFSDSFLAGLADGAYAVITYTAVVSATAGDFAGDDAHDYGNDAQVTYGSSSKSEVAKTDTMSYGFEVYKYTGNLQDEGGTPLANAQFQLTDSSDMYATFTYDSTSGMYIFAGWAESTENLAEGVTATLISASGSGKILIEGLHDGTYTLTETQAPDGYNKLTGTISVQISSTGDVSFTYSDTSGGGAAGDSSNTKQVNVQNNTGAEMPSTGGIGTTIFYVIGAILVCGAVVLLVTRKRMGKENG